MSTNENKGKKAEVTALQAISAEDRKKLDFVSLRSGRHMCMRSCIPIGSIVSRSNAYMACNYFRFFRLLNCSSRYGRNRNDRL